MVDRKGERGHELAMRDKRWEFEKIRDGGTANVGNWRVLPTRGNVGAIEPLREAVRTQGEKTGVRWADALSISVPRHHLLVHGLVLPPRLRHSQQL